MFKEWIVRTSVFFLYTFLIFSLISCKVFDFIGRAKKLRPGQQDSVQPVDDNPVLSNRAPQLGLIESQALFINQSIIPIDINDENTSSDQDLDGDRISYGCYSIYQGNQYACDALGFNFDSTIGKLSGRPSSIGLFRFYITGADGQGEDDKILFDINVNEINSNCSRERMFVKSLGNRFNMDLLVIQGGIVPKVIIQDGPNQVIIEEQGTIDYQFQSAPPHLTTIDFCPEHMRMIQYHYLANDNKGVDSSLDEIFPFGLNRLDHLEFLSFSSDFNSNDGVKGSIRSGFFQNNQRLVSLGLSGSQINTLESGWAQGLGHLQTLYLPKAKNIKHLKSSMFVGLTKLEDLDFYGAGITSIEEGFGSNLGNLKSLRLSGEKVQDMYPLLPSSIFSLMPLLEKITLHQVALPNFGLAENLFQGNQRLKEIDLELPVNEIDLDTAIFDGLGELSRLKISSWIKGTINQGVFSSLGNLKTLVLGPSGFSSECRLLGQLNVNALGQMPFLEDLRIKDCGLSGQLTENLFTQNTSLRIINLEDNELTGDLTGNLFEHLNDLWALNLRGNDFYGDVTLPEGVESRQLSLNLSANQFSSEEIKRLLSDLKTRFNTEANCHNGLFSLTQDPSAFVQENNSDLLGLKAKGCNVFVDEISSIGNPIE
jgi:hypothetical protein